MLVVYFGAPGENHPNLPKWRNRQTRTTQNRVPSGNEGSIPSFGTRIILYRYFRKNILLAGGCFVRNDLTASKFPKPIKHLSGNNFGRIANLPQNVSVVFDEINNSQGMD